MQMHNKGCGTSNVLHRASPQLGSRHPSIKYGQSERRTVSVPCTESLSSAKVLRAMTQSANPELLARRLFPKQPETNACVYEHTPPNEDIGQTRLAPTGAGGVDQNSNLDFARKDKQGGRRNYLPLVRKGRPSAGTPCTAVPPASGVSLPRSTRPRYAHDHGASLNLERSTPGPSSNRAGRVG